MKTIKKLYTKLVDKIFGKRCSCPDNMLRNHQPMKCKQCGKIHI